MRTILLILFLCHLLALPAQGQKVVLNAADLPHLPGLYYAADVEGKVLVMELYYDLIRQNNYAGQVTVYPNWPVEVYGSSEQGGVYGNIDSDPELELVYNAGLNTYAFNLDGSVAEGWPAALDLPPDGAPAFGDIDGNGSGDIVVTTHQAPGYTIGSVHAFKKDGTYVPGFPVSLPGGPLRTPVLADLDNDEALEIIIAVRQWPDGYIHVYRGDGSMYPGFPVSLEYPPGSAVAAGDITGDGIPEIVAESYYRLYAFHHDGTPLPGFPYLPGPDRVFSYSSPVLADIDGDGLREIIAGDHSVPEGNGAVHIIKSDGIALEGWPQLTDFWIYGSPSVGDIDGDGELDIAVGDQVLSGSPVNQVYAWTGATGDPLTGFPVTGVNGINCQIILADLDGDSHPELMFDDNTAVNSMGKYHGYNHDGTPMEGWPLEITGSSFLINPMAVDINRDGILDLSGGGTHPGTGDTYFYLWNAGVPHFTELAILPILQYNTRHNGVYGDYLMVGTPETGIPGSFSLKLYPNPASSWLSVGLDGRARGTFRAPSPYQDKDGTRIAFGQQSCKIILSDQAGRRLSEFENIMALPYLIDISSLKPGMYLLHMMAGDQRSVTAEFLKIPR